MQEPRAALSRKTAWLIALPPGILMFTIGVIGISSRDMWHDEYATWLASTRSWREMVSLLSDYDFVLGPYYIVMHVWVSIAGDSLTALRVLSLVAMSASAGFIALVGRRLFDPAVGLVAGLLFAVVPAIARYGQEARPYGFAMLFTLLSVLALLRALESPSKRRWVLYSIALIGAGVSHIVAITGLAAHAVLVAHDVRAGKDVNPWHWVRAAGAAVVVLAPIVLIGSQQTVVISWIQRDASEFRRGCSVRRRSPSR